MYKPSSISSRRLSIAPMMAYSDKHFRYFMRCISEHYLLYTEMISTGALLHGDKHRLLDFNAAEHPLALQLGGSDPKQLQQCAKIATEWGYDEINLNVGCPSDRVQNRNFGACLMAEPQLVAQCVDSMRQATSLPITIKCRTGIDDMDSYDYLRQFISIVSDAGCESFIIHARKAWLQGLSPKQNREIPPLQYDRVYQLKLDFPQLHFTINGGFNAIEQINEQYEHVDGVMVGRAAYQDPYLLVALEQTIFKQTRPLKSREQILEQFSLYVSKQLKAGVYLKHLIKPILGLYKAQPGARAYRRMLSEHAHQPNQTADLIQKAILITQECTKTEKLITL